MHAPDQVSVGGDMVKLAASFNAAVKGPGQGV
jgi:hypothetical protein